VELAQVDLADFAAEVAPLLVTRPAGEGERRR
jgi:hypothetical protein